MPPPRNRSRSPVKKKDLSNITTDDNTSDPETQEAILNLIVSNFAPLPQDSLDSDMKVDPTLEKSSTQPSKQDHLSDNHTSFSSTIDSKSASFSILKRQKCQEETKSQLKKLNTSKQIPDTALNNRYTSSC